MVLGVHGVEGVTHNGDDGGQGSDDHAKVGKGVAEKPTRCYFIAVLADGKNVLGRKRGLVRDSLSRWISGEHQGFRRLPQVQFDQR